MRTVLLVLLVLTALYFIGEARDPSPPPEPPSHRVFVESLTCEDVAGVRSRAFVTIRNTGETTIEYARAHVRIGGEVASGYLSPRPLRPGGIADAMIYNTSSGPEPCEIVSVSDRDGHQATVI